VSPPEPLRVVVTRSGGFAGLARRWELDAADLPPEEGETLHRLACAALTADPSSDPGAARDAFTFTVDVHIGDAVRTVRAGERGAAARVADLLRFVQQHADPRPPGQ
jgi:hypothetical protein